MSGQRTSRLHLPDLSIHNFRGIEHLTISKLGRVTLLGGQNGVGKTTVLEAVRVHAARGKQNVLAEVLDKHEEFAPALDDDFDRVVSQDYTALFNGRTPTQDRPIVIGPGSGKDDLRIEIAKPSEWSKLERTRFAKLKLAKGGDVQAIRVIYGKNQKLLPWLSFAHDRRVSRFRQPTLFDDSDWPVIECESLEPGLPNNSKLASFLDNVALTEREDLSLQALRLVSPSIERVAAIGDHEGRYRGTGRRIVVKLRDHPNPVPLKSLGDGVTRLFAAGLALANSSDGFLVVDEAENGIHYSVQKAFWNMVLRAAHQHDVQVLATTHSSDCVNGFARAAVEFEEAEGAYVRLERFGNQVRAVEYTEDELLTVAEQGIESR